MNSVILDGMPGEPLPYLLHSDWMVTGVLFVCVILVCIVFSRGRKHLIQIFRNFLQNRERSSMFDEATVMDTRHTLLLIGHSWLMLGFCAYYYGVNTSSLMFEGVSYGWLLFGFMLCVAVLQLLKWGLYQTINWIFFQKVRSKLWITAFFHLQIGLGLCLLPVFLLVVYFDISSQLSFWTIGFLLVLAKLALFWKCFSNFFEKIYGVLHLILYFCALEILPDLIWWKGMEWMNNNLILNL